MLESNEESGRRDLRVSEGKEIAYYTIVASAWIETRMERDKTLVTLSAAAIGLLVTLLTTVGARSFLEVALFVCAALAFIVTLTVTLRIFARNSDHLEAIAQGKSGGDPTLEKYDKFAVRSFLFGVVIFFLIGLLSAFLRFFSAAVTEMSKQNNQSVDSTMSASFKESVNGVSSLTPLSSVTKSFNGISSLSPKASQPSTQPQTQPQSSAATQNSAEREIPPAGDNSESKK